MLIFLLEDCGNNGSFHAICQYSMVDEDYIGLRVGLAVEHSHKHHHQNGRTTDSCRI